MSDTQTEIARRCTLFAHCLLLDESTTQSLAEKIFNEVVDSDELDSDFVTASYKLSKKYSNVEPDGFVARPTWKLSKNIDIKAWKRFRDESVREEFLTLLWCQVLQIKREKVAHSLAVSLGTVDYRVAKGLHRLTKCLEEENADG